MKKNVFFAVFLLMMAFTPLSANNPLANCKIDTILGASVAITDTDTVRQLEQCKPVEENSIEKSNDSIDQEKLIADLKSALAQMSLRDSLRNDTLRALSAKCREDSLSAAHMRRVLADTMNAHIVSAFGRQCKNADEIFCSFLLESPLYYAYNDSLVARSLEMAQLLGYSDKSSPYYFWYGIYEPLLNNYAAYTNEIVQDVKDVLEKFRKWKLDRETEKILFQSRIDVSNYYKVKGTGTDGEFRHIVFLDYRISRILSLFDSDEAFNAKNFEREYKKLLGQSDDN